LKRGWFKGTKSPIFLSGDTSLKGGFAYGRVEPRVKDIKRQKHEGVYLSQGGLGKLAKARKTTRKAVLCDNPRLT